MKKNILLMIIIIIGPSLQLHAMKKTVGAIETIAGAGALAANASTTMLALNALNCGVSVMNPFTLAGVSVAALGIGCTASGIERLFSKGEAKVEAGQVLIKFKDPQTAEFRWIRYSDANTTDIEKFLNRKGFLISWREDYPTQKLNEQSIQIINDETKALQRQYGIPRLYNNHVQIADPQLRAEHAQKIENPYGVDALASQLAQRENLFISLRRLAIHSWGTPTQKDNLALFVKPASEVIAKLMQVVRAADTYPYEELVRNEIAAKNQFQLQFNQVQANYNQAQANFAQERVVRNQLQNNLNQTQATLAQREAELQAEQAAKQQTERNARQENEAAEYMQAQDETIIESYRQRFIRTHRDLQESEQANQDNENLLESYRDRVVRLADLNHMTTTALEREREQHNIQNENLRRQMAQQSEQAAREYESVRSQLSPLRRRANEVSPLRRENEELKRLLVLAQNTQQTHARHDVQK